MPERPVIQVRTYREGTQELAAKQFETDAAKAAREGYLPTSQAWEGATLTVTYQYDAARDSFRQPPPERLADRQPPPANVVQHGGGLSGGLGQRFGFGAGCLLLIAFLVAGCWLLVNSTGP